MAAIDPERLRKALERAPMNPAQLAEAVGISHDYVLNILGGHRRLKRNVVLRHQIARALQVPVDWIEVPRPDPERVA